MKVTRPRRWMRRCRIRGSSGALSSRDPDRAREGDSGFAGTQRPWRQELDHHRRGGCVLATLFGSVLALVACSQVAVAANDLIVIDEILASWQGDSEIQFIELRMTAVDQNEVTGAEIEILDRNGGLVQRLQFPSSVTTGAEGSRILIATPKLEGLAGLDADFRIEDPIAIPLIRRQGGRICYRATDAGSDATIRVDCVAYGTYRGGNSDFGTPTPITPVNRSLQRVQDTSDNDADFQGVLEPTPQNNRGDRAVLQTTCLDDGNIDSGEECDGSNLDGKTCVSEGFAGGTLRCFQCHLDTSDCTDCGNGTVDAGEDCDGSNLDGQTCMRLGFTRGTLACSEGCAFDTSACEERQIPGGKTARKDCFLQWSVINPWAPVSKERPKRNQLCVDGDSSCDFDGGTTNSCTFNVRLCFNRDDSRLKRCTARGVSTFDVRRPSSTSADAVDQANAEAILAAVAALGSSTREGSRVRFSPSLETGDVCTDVVSLVVPLRERPGKRARRGKRVLKTLVVDGQGKRRDRDKIKLKCIPGAG